MKPYWGIYRISLFKIQSEPELAKLGTEIRPELEPDLESLFSDHTTTHCIYHTGVINAVCCYQKAVQFSASIPLLSLFASFLTKFVERQR